MGVLNFLILSAVGIVLCISLFLGMVGLTKKVFKNDPQDKMINSRPMVQDQSQLTKEIQDRQSELKRQQDQKMKDLKRQQEQKIRDLQRRH